MTTLSKLFKNLDLSSRSQFIYKEIVKHGPISASSVAKILNLPRSTVYLELDNLKKNGLISYSGSSKKRRFMAEKPSQLLDLINEKAEFFSNLLPSAEKAVQEIEEELLSKHNIIPEIKFFSGVDGIKKVLNSTLTSKSKEVLGILPAYDLFVATGEKYMSSLVHERVKKGIRVKNIWPVGNVPSYISKHREQLRDVRFSEEQNKLKSAIITFDDYVILITSTAELFSVQIKSPDLSQAMRYLFEAMWLKAKN